MKSAKFKVIKLKEVIKTGVFALVGLAVILLIIYFLVPGGMNKTAKYTPGTYSAEIMVDNEPITLYITVTDKKITGVELGEVSETLPYFYPLFESTAQAVGEEVIKKQSLDVAIPEDAPVTAGLILDAIEEGLTLAQAEE